MSPALWKWQKIPYYMPLPNFAENVSGSTLQYLRSGQSQQSSDWGQRPLTDTQLNYAKIDPVYLSMVHHQLLHLKALSNPDPATEDVAMLGKRYLELKQQLQVLIQSSLILKPGSKQPCKLKI